MGVNMTKLDLCKLNNNEKKLLFDPNAPEPEMTISQARILTDMWRTLKDDISKVGVITFVRYVFLLRQLNHTFLLLLLHKHIALS